jgi:hypothetical protein
VNAMRQALDEAWPSLREARRELKVNRGFVLEGLNESVGIAVAGDFSVDITVTKYIAAHRDNEHTTSNEH